MSSLSSHSHEAHPFKVLIVDDIPAERKLASRLFPRDPDSAGALEIIMAEDGQEAWEMYEKALEEGKPFHLVCSDHEMPRLSGAELLKNIIHRSFSLSPAVSPDSRSTGLTSPTLILRTSVSRGEFGDTLSPEIHHLQKNGSPEEISQIKKVISDARAKHLSPPVSPDVRDSGESKFIPSDERELPASTAITHEKSCWPSWCCFGPSSVKKTASRGYQSSTDSEDDHRP
jgi:CheY-like chemotaxis protein